MEAEAESPEVNLTEGTGEGTSINQYDALNRLIQTTTGETVAKYTYNGDNLRVSKQLNDGETTRFILDGANVVAEIQGEKVTLHVRADQLITSSDSEGNRIYYNYNPHGDVVQLVDANGTVTKTYDYDAFGVEQNPDPEDQNPFRYCGEYFDSETGNIYLRARYYDPAIGRFASEDPIMAGLNWYVYGNNNPIMFVDPWGLDAVIITADDAAEGQGHTSVLIQDTNDGKWYYFYWGDKAAYYIEVPWQEGAMNSLDKFNAWLSKQNLPYNTTNYTSATFVEGDFNASSDYFKNLVANTIIEKGYRSDANPRYDKPALVYYVENTSYKLFGKNCLQMSMEGFRKGTLKDGTNAGDFISGQLDATYLANTRPNTAEAVFNQLFFNRRFTRNAARNDVTWEAKYGSPPSKYKNKGMDYARTLGVI